MPHKSKRARQAEAQHASGTQFFDARFTDNIDEYIGDPNYSPDIEGENEGWAFGFFEGEVAVATDDSDDDEWEDEDDISPVVLGSKRKVAESIMGDSDEDEADDLEESSTLEAARMAQQIWSEFFEKVSEFQ